MSTHLQDRFDVALPLHKTVLRSWRSMKPWVVVWLWYLNVLYWISFFYLSRPEAFWAAISYLAVGPFIGILVTRQRGLTRLSGLIHLPWIPFVIYLGLHLFSGAPVIDGPQATDIFYQLWLQTLFWSTLACLIFDVIDVGRWLAGERYVLGMPAAAAAGACKPLTNT